MRITTEDYIEYLENVAKRINENKDYITKLDATTGDGDHWVNMNMGFSKILDSKDELKNLSIKELLKKIGMIMMSTVGGSSGVLYGGAYINASKKLGDVDFLNEEGILILLEAISEAIMSRGKVEFGNKTMLDSLYPAVETYKQKLNEKVSYEELLEAAENSSKNGMQETKNMKATKGRASYRNDKGVGHLDPGAVTMYYQISELVQFLKSKI